MIFVKRIIAAILVILAAAAFSYSALSKSAKELDIKFNPDVKFEDLKQKDITIYDFDNTASEGDVTMETVYVELIEFLEESDINADLINPDKIGKKKSEFSLDSLDEDADREKLYEKSPTDLVLCGDLIRLDAHEKSSLVEDKKFWSASMEFFVYSKSLKAIIYKASVTRILKQKAFLKFKKLGKDARRTVFRSCIEDALTPFIEELNYSAGMKATDSEHKYKNSMRYLKRTEN